MQTGTGSIDRDAPRGSEPFPFTSQTLLSAAAIFVASYVFLFLGMTMRPAIYDEGLVLTAAMRVAAGQIPHRDFYANYGPADFYAIAALFRLFGQSLLIERLYSLFVEASLVVSTYAILSSYCRRSTAFWTSIAVLLWLFGIGATSGSPLIPALLANMLGCALVLPVLSGATPRWRIFLAGAISGIGALFRYDTGVALFCIQTLTIAIAAVVGRDRSKLREFLSNFGTCFAGFALVTLPPAIYFASVAPLRSFVHDIILYPSKYYRVARGLPFPGVSLKTLDNVEVYLPLVIVGVSLYLWLSLLKTARAGGDTHEECVRPRQSGFLLTFSILSAVMYLKGLVRVGVGQMFLAIVPSLFLLALLFDLRLSLPQRFRQAIVAFIWLSSISVVWADMRTVKALRAQHASVPEYLVAASRRSLPEVQAGWCERKTPMTRGLCFSSDDDRIRTTEYIDNHSTADQTLFVGLDRHDRIFVNDNLIYFASHRLPATKWSHFDPDLQNRLDVQTEMIHELEMSRPPYVIEDSEFAASNEPNDSSKSTGVTLLDDYIRNHYRLTQTFGVFAVWQRNPAR